MGQPGRSSMRLFLISGVCGLLAAQQAAPPPAQQQPTTATEDPETRIAVSVDYVSTPAWVYDRDGNTVSGLQPNQFRLFDNNKEQNIQVDVSFTPISLVICIQANAHVEGMLPQVRKIGSMV